MQRGIVIGLFLMVAPWSGALMAQSSPFQRTGIVQSTNQAEAKEQPFTFAGLVKMGANPLICVTEIASKRSHWLKIGQTISGISLVDFDSENNVITVRHNGQTHLLTLAEATFDSGNLVAYQSASPLRSAGVAETVPLTNEEKATDARMLVSDLLEIGLIQRKAYEKAKADEVVAKREAAKEN
ncbi:MAG: hypothetical protein QNL51_16770 [Opitutaceae bacterium]|tara:strand:+ start:1690 stop:2238 length:549 start_codon:yes stop_codon:yes gene_type:complete